MEEEVEEFVTIDPFSDEEDIDFVYEFDAPRFCDFTQPETYFEAAEAEQWFEFAGSYPPAPFLVKLRWGNTIPTEVELSLADYGDGADDSAPCIEPEEVSENKDNSRGLEFYNQAIPDTLNGKTKPLSRSTQSKSFMKPTASHLAKQKNPSEVQTHQSFRRCQNQSSSSSSSVDGQLILTKRQKLEAGYLRKAACLKHQTLFTHKKTKEVKQEDLTGVSRHKVTIPREPTLETALRAQRHKSRTDAESVGHTKSSSHMFKARPLNKKIFEAPLPSHKKKTPQLTEFQVFHFKTSERAMQHTSSCNAGGILNSNFISNIETRDPKRTSSPDGSRQEKCRMVNKHRGSPDDKRLSRKEERGVFRDIKVFPLEPNDKRSLNEPPSELFSKLSLASDVKQTKKSQSKEQPTSKGLKENRPGIFHQEHQEQIQRLCGQEYQGVNDIGSLISKHACILEPGH